MISVSMTKNPRKNNKRKAPDLMIIGLAILEIQINQRQIQNQNLNQKRTQET